MVSFHKMVPVVRKGLELGDATTVDLLDVGLGDCLFCSLPEDTPLHRAEFIREELERTTGTRVVVLTDNVVLLRAEGPLTLGQVRGVLENFNRNATPEERIDVEQAVEKIRKESLAEAPAGVASDGADSGPEAAR